MKYIETYKIDVGKNFYDDIKVKQNDTARYIRFEIFQNSIPFDITGKNIRIYGIKPDKKILWNGCTLEDETNGKILVPITSQMTAVPGTLKAELTIIEGDDILSSIPFEIKVIPCVRDDKAVESTNEFKDVFSTKITTSIAVDGVLQLTKDKYQIAEVPSGTEIKMPESIRADEYTNINLIINAKEDKFFVFDDIKWKEKPSLKAGYDYVISFTCINNIWYGEITEYKEFEKSYLYKNGDECSALSGGWDYIEIINDEADVNSIEYSKEKYGWAKHEEYIEYQGYQYGLNYWYMQYFQTANAIDFSNYTKMYVEYSIEKYIHENGTEEDVSGTPISVKVGNTTLMNKATLTPKTVEEFDVSSISDSQKVGFGMMTARSYSTVTNKLKIYKIWLE